MKYLITGGCGFIGSHLADALLARGADVRLLDDLSTGKKENAPGAAEIFKGDIRDQAAVQESLKGCSGVFHLAAIASVARCINEKEFCHSVNLTGSGIVFSAAAAKALPVVFASSAAVYGNAQDLPISESHATVPLSYYGEDKLAGEKLLEDFSARGLKSAALRFFNVYGPRQSPDSDYSGVISIFMRRLNDNLGLTIYGDGEQSRDFIYVGDVVSHLIAAMENVQQQTGAGSTVYNVCRSESVSINQLAATLGDVLGVKPTIAHGPARTGDIRHSLGDNQKAIQRLGIQATTSFKNGLAQTMKELA